MILSISDTKQINRILYSRDQQFFSAILPWVQWLHVYAFVSGVTFGYLFIVIFDIYLLIRHININGFVIRAKKNGFEYLIIFFFYIFFALSIIVLSGYPIKTVSVLNRLFKLICLYFLVLICDSKNICWSIYEKSLKCFTYLACAALIIQFVMSMISGSYYNFKIPFLRYANESTDLRIGEFSSGYRYKSVFTEPSHFVFFVLQYLCILLFSRINCSWKRVVEAISISIVTVLSISSTGIVLVSFVWSMFFILILKTKRYTKKSVLLLLLIILLFGLTAYVVLNNDLLSFSLYRLTGSYERSDVVWKRINSNFEDIKNMKSIYLLFGYGVGNVESEFMNSIVYTILNFGIIGLIILVIGTVKIFIKSNICGRIALIVFLILSAIDMVIFTPTALGYLIIVKCFQDRKEINNE